MNQLTIVKIDGKMVEDSPFLHTFLKDFSQIAGHKILIHGREDAAAHLAEEPDVKNQLIDNKNIVARLQALSLDAVGLTGADMNLIFAVQSPVRDRNDSYTGDIREVNAPVLKELLNQNYVPVIAPITHNGAGLLLTTDADAIAGETAKALAYDFNVRLIYCLDKKGVLLDETDENSVVQSLSKEEFQQYKTSGIIRNNMLSKLEMAFAARSSGVKEVIFLRASHLNIGEGTFIE
jgi:acetylglutamate kinase